MSQSIKYKSVFPQNVKDIYSDYDMVDFVVKLAPNEDLSLGSVRLTGNLQLQNEILDDEIYYNPLSGVHSFIDSIKVSSLINGQIEHIDDYAMYFSSLQSGSVSLNDVSANSVYGCQGICPSKMIASQLLKGTCLLSDVDEGEPNELGVEPLDFSLKPLFCLNRHLGGATTLTSSKVGGELRISFVIARLTRSCWGSQRLENGEITTQFSNLKLTYITTAMNKMSSQPCSLRTVSSVKTTLNSNYSAFVINAPVVASSLWCVFHKTATEYSALENSYKQETPPNVSDVQFLWNDSFTNQSITYQLQTQEEILFNFIKAIGGEGSVSMCNLNNVFSNTCYGIGLSFDGAMVNMASSRFNINLTSGISPQVPYTCYMYLQGLLNI
jgi:hypothetical protein